MKKILITAIGGDIGQSIAQCINNSDENFYLYGTDINNKHGGSRYVNEYCIVPQAKDPRYLESISDLVDKKNIDVIIPVNEKEIKIIVNNPKINKVIHCGRELVNIGLDKLRTIESLESLGIKVPWTVDADKEMPKDYPCIIKPRFSSGSKSIFVIDNQKEAVLFASKHPQSVFQELLEPNKKEITCCIYKKKDGYFGSIQFERSLVGGLTGWAKVIYCKRVERVLNIIANHLILSGSLNVQLRITDKGPMIFEINPRFSSTCYMRHKLGFTDVIWSLKECFDKQVDLIKVKNGAILYRTHDVTVM